MKGKSVKVTENRMQRGMHMTVYLILLFIQDNYTV